MKTISSILALLLFAPAIGGCAASAAQDDARAPVEAREVTRAIAVAQARQDASRSYGDGWVPVGDAQYRGGFWVVDLHAADGAMLHYAISGRDGSIRERNISR